MVATSTSAASAGATGRPAQVAAGIEPVRRLYDLRHTYATFALRAGVSVFAVSRFMGTSLAMIDRHYGHLARDSREHAVSLLDALVVERAVDAGWTPRQKPANPLSDSNFSPRRSRSRDRWTLGGRRHMNGRLVANGRS